MRNDVYVDSTSLVPVCSSPLTPNALVAAPLPRRLEMAEALARSYLHLDDRGEQRAALRQLFAVLDDSMVEVRLRVAELFADRNDAPRAIMLRLIDDVPAVSAIVYARSPLLRASHLREALQRGEPRIACAVAQRLDLDDGLVAAMLEGSDVSACKVLISNPYVRLGGEAIMQFITRFADDAEALEVLRATRKLAPEHLCLLVAACAQAYQGNAFVRALVPSKRLERLADAARERALLAVLRELDEASSARALTVLFTQGSITPSLLLRVALCGDIAVLEALVSCLAATPQARVRSAFVHARPAVAAALLKRTGLSEDVRTVLCMALVLARELAQADVPWTADFFCDTLIEIVDQRSSGANHEDDLGAVCADETLALCHSLAADIMQEQARGEGFVDAVIPAQIDDGDGIIDAIEALDIAPARDSDDVSFDFSVSLDDAFGRAVA